MMFTPELQEKARKIKLLLLDADGILTDGRIYYGDYGDEIKSFDVHDGVGLFLWAEAGRKSCILTAKKSSILKRRAKEIRVSKVYHNSHRKIRSYEIIKKKFHLKDEEVCYMGDDLIDIGVLKKVGLAITVPQAPQEVKVCVDYITQHNGGRGAVREVVELILKTQGLWEELISRFYE